MELETAANCLGELGNSTRLDIFRLLVRAGPDGVTVGEIQRHLSVPASTLSHHIAHLVWSGLIDQERRGRSLHCRARPDVMDALIEFLTDECCTGLPDDVAPTQTEAVNADAAGS